MDAVIRPAIVVKGRTECFICHRPEMACSLRYDTVKVNKIPTRQVVRGVCPGRMVAIEYHGLDGSRWAA